MLGDVRAPVVWDAQQVHETLNGAKQHIAAPCIRENQYVSFGFAVTGHPIHRCSYSRAVVFRAMK